LAAKHHPDEVIWVEAHHFERLQKPPDKDFDAEAFRDSITHLAATSQADFETYMEKLERPPMPDVELKKLLPDYIYKRFKDMFSPKLANELPP
jgi:hypothetical protein